LGTYQIDDFKSHSHLETGAAETYGTYGSNWGYAGIGDRSSGLAGGNETRPKNRALLYCQKT